MLTASSDPIRESILEKTSDGYWRGGLICIEMEWHSTEHCVSLGGGCLIILAYSLSRLWRRTFWSRSPYAVRAMAARCKLPFTLSPGLSQEDMKRTTGKTKEIEAHPLVLSRGCHERERGQEQRVSLGIESDKRRKLYV